jgi:hypothetical protein
MNTMNQKYVYGVVLVILAIVIAVVIYRSVATKNTEVLLPSVEPSSLLGPNNCKPGYPCAVIEDEGKIKVSNTPEVQALAQKYGWPHVHIKAVDIKLIEDIAFVRSIYPNFKEEMGCIIIVHAGENEGYVYQEDKDLNIIYRESLSEFMKRTSTVDSATIAKFYLSLH